MDWRQQEGDKRIQQKSFQMNALNKMISQQFQILQEDIKLNNINVEGTEDFKQLRINSQIYVDKSELISEFQNMTQHFCIVRPKRWGKSINMSMIKYFYQIPVDKQGNIVANPNTYLFKGGDILDTLDKNALLKGQNRKLQPLKICNNAQVMKKHGMFPVIHMNLRDLKQQTIKDMQSAIQIKIAQLYKQKQYLQNTGSQELKKEYQQSYQKLIKVIQSPNKSQSNGQIYLNLIKKICQMLRKFHKKSCIVLIDSFDTPTNYLTSCLLENKFGENYKNIQKTRSKMLQSMVNHNQKIKQARQKWAETQDNIIIKQLFFDPLYNANRTGEIIRLLTQENQQKLQKYCQTNQNLNIQQDFINDNKSITNMQQVDSLYLFIYLGYLTVRHIKKDCYRICIPNNQIKVVLRRSFKKWLANNNLQQAMKFDEIAEFVQIKLLKSSLEQLDCFFNVKKQSKQTQGNIQQDQIDVKDIPCKRIKQ